MPPFSAKNLFNEIIRNYLFRKRQTVFRKLEENCELQPSAECSSEKAVVGSYVIMFSRYQSQLPTIVLLKTTLTCMIRLTHQEYSSALHMIQRWKMIPEDLTKKIWNSMESVQYRNQLILLKKETTTFKQRFKSEEL